MSRSLASLDCLGDVTYGATLPQAVRARSWDLCSANLPLTRAGGGATHRWSLCGSVGVRGGDYSLLHS